MAGSESDRPADRPSAEELREVSRDIDAAFPASRFGTEVVLLDVDPHRAHAYWNVDLEDYEEGCGHAGPEARLVLRVHDVTGVAFDGRNANDSFDVEVQGLQGHWYLDLWKDGRDYLAELGLRKPDGGLQLLARSNAVSTPMGAPSSVYDTSAVQTAPGVPDESRITALGMGAPDAFAPLQPDAASAAPLPPAAPATGEDAPGWPTGEEAAAGMPEAPGTVEEYYERHIGPESAVTWTQEASEHEVSRAEEKKGEPAPADGRAQGPAVLPLENYVNLSSFVQARRDVLIEVNTELHIFGRVKPGTELSLYGQKVPLRPDGGFSIRRPLPQGAVVLPLLATDGAPPSP